MQYSKLKLRIRGVSPLVMHNGQMADPLNKFYKEMKKVSGKRAKTESDFEQMAKIEFLGGLYLHNGAPCIPGELVEAVFIDGAKKQKRGQQARAGTISDGFWSLEYDGPRSPDDLWADERFRLSVGVRVQRNRIIRTRPIFREWESEIGIDFLPDQLNGDEIIEIVKNAGRIVGLCDWRPKFGRFEVVSIA